MMVSNPSKWKHSIVIADYEQGGQWNWDIETARKTLVSLIAVLRDNLDKCEIGGLWGGSNLGIKELDSIVEASLDQHRRTAWSGFGMVVETNDDDLYYWLKMKFT